MPKILLVDDARTVRLICRRVCTEMGFETLEAENGQQALEVLRANPDIALLLLDWHMPVMDGLTCLRTLRADHSLAQPRVVMCTTQSELHDISTALNAGADEYIMKPFTEEVMRDKILECGVARHS